MSVPTDEKAQTGPRVMRVARRVAASAPPRVVASGDSDGAPLQPGTATRRDVLKGAATAAAATTVATAARDADAAKRTSSTGDLCLYSDLRAVKEAGIRSLHPCGDGRHLAVVDTEGVLRFWDLDSPQAPLVSGRKIKGVRQVATGTGDRVVWLAQGKLTARSMSEPKKALFTVRVRGAEAVAIDPRNGELLVLVEGALRAHDPVKGRAIRERASLPLPEGETAPGTLRADADGVLWMIQGASPWRLGDAGWETLELPTGTTRVAMDPMAERLALWRGDQVELTRLPERTPVGLPRPIVAGDGDPVWEGWLRSVARVHAGRLGFTVQGLDGDVSSRDVRFGTKPPTVFIGLPRQRGYIWGDEDGRLVYLRYAGWQHVVLADPKAVVTGRSKPGECGETWVGFACTCNTVNVKRGERRRSYVRWVPETGTWVHRSVARRDSVPAAASCTCNTVAVGGGAFFRSVCSCNSVCTCNTVCSCQSTGGGGGYGYRSYWYPN